jgi:hypothetical protein
MKALFDLKNNVFIKDFQSKASEETLRNNVKGLDRPESDFEIRDISESQIHALTLEDRLKIQEEKDKKENKKNTDIKNLRQKLGLSDAEMALITNP